MKYSCFNFQFSYKGIPGVFNTLTGSIVLFDNQDENIFLKKIGELSSESIKKYKSLGLIIEDNLDERKALLDIRKRKLKREPKPYFRVFTTYGCNANCFYCFEKKDNSCYMNEETAKAVANFICDHSNNKKVNISWFGGEPLLNYKIITFICRLLKGSNLPFDSAIVTNGSLVTEEIAKLAIDEWNLKTAQITLDGFGDEHNKRKAYAEGFDGFQKTIDSIHLLAQNGIKVTIRLNINDSNIASINRLIDFLKEEFGGEANVNCYSHFLFENNFYNSKNNSHLQPYEINKRLIQCGFLNKDYQFNFLKQRTGMCGFCGNDHYCIEPDGSLLKCPDDVTSRYGSIFNEEIDKDMYEKWIATELDEKCEECIFEPLCQGGCRCAHFHGFAHTCEVDEALILAGLNDFIDQNNEKGKMKETNDK